ncbi:hypothetical protein AOQ84DRAFT_395890 [Glonium stellatum]|uniref:Homing endonuclease LAGLIDADG domain-containing protein n=1 Tax=Glonium stellatum TaxID=574774 RepID=A0A8E2F7N6_9PEZI|nr:hypothetical protein AOQ84DRAFT_395890 [Glonium stellatum]
MIFFMVMPALIGGFDSKIEEPKLRLKLGAYLAGLIEADGSFAIHDKDSKAKRYLPKILIVFSLNDSPLAEKLMSIIKVGKFFYNINIEPLAGFTDGDGNFSINLVDRKKKGAITTKRVQVFFRIELRQNYHRYCSVEQGTRYLEVNLYSRSREQNDKIFYSYMVVSHNIQSHTKVIEYFDRYPLHVVQEITLRAGKPLIVEDILEIEKIKAQFNKKRTQFDFSHLDSIV